MGRILWPKYNQSTIWRNSFNLVFFKHLLLLLTGFLSFFFCFLLSSLPISHSLPPTFFSIVFLQTDMSFVCIHRFSLSNLNKISLCYFIASFKWPNICMHWSRLNCKCRPSLTPNPMESWAHLPRSVRRNSHHHLIWELSVNIYWLLHNIYWLLHLFEEQKKNDWVKCQAKHRLFILHEYHEMRSRLKSKQ